MNNFTSQTSADFTKAMQDYDRLNRQYQQLQNQYTGNAGYNNSLQQASKGAGVVAQGQANQTQAAARNAGMNKAQAAAMGANTINGTYGNNFQNQQSQAAQMGMNALNAQNNAMQNTMQGANAYQTEQQNRYSRAWGNLNNAVGLGASGLQAIGNAVTTGANIFGSDERIKDSKELPEGISKAMADIDSFLFKYKDEAQKKYPDITDDQIHVGIMAQELEANPVTENVVETLPDGTKAVDSDSLTATNTALISDLAKRLEGLENRLNDLFPLGKENK